MIRKAAPPSCRARRAVLRCRVVIGSNARILIINETRMDGTGGLDLLETLTRERPRLPVIILTGLSGGSAADAMEKGAFHYFTAPLDVEELRG